jgi:uncharacterized membrane protein YeaQ/YmgE (transglycosylase-associated protein family)
MRARLSSVAILLGLISTTAVAHAQDGPPPGRSQGNPQVSSTESQETVSESYAWQVMLADGASTALLFTDFGDAMGLGLGGYLLGGPLIHAAHGNVGTGLGSAGLRVSLPVVGFVAGAFVHEGDPAFTDMTMLKGAMVGMLGAVVIDWLLLSWDERPAPAETGRSLVVVPGVGVNEQGVSLGVTGRF